MRMILFGDARNIAVRLEEELRPREGVCPISDDAHSACDGKVILPVRIWPSADLKNIAEPVQVWRMRLEVTKLSDLDEYFRRTGEFSSSLTGPDRVLPFQI